jgi:rhomboid protease GluP
VNRSGRRATVAVCTGTAILTGASIAYPSVLLALERSPQALAGQWWRLVTPVFVERGGWVEIAFNLVSLGVVGVLAERVYGSGRWVLFYVAGGLTGEAIGLAWRPIGAGSSVGVCGLLGAWAVWAVRQSGAYVAAGLAVFAGALILAVRHNLHGPPVIVGAVLAGLLGLPRESGEQAGRLTTR